MTVAYGKQTDGGVALGSLDLLDPQRKFEMIGITAKAIEGMGEAELETWSSLPHASFDLVIMNPPFTRPTGHEAKKIGVPNPMFAAFGSSDEEQRLMGQATKRLTNGTSAHGNAGEASIFLVLADRKLKPNGILALVMPVSLMSGDAWEKSRALLAHEYRDLTLVSIAGVDGADLSFSADTDIGECLVVGRKNSKGSERAVFVILNERPKLPMLGVTAARQISQLIVQKRLRCLEDGPMGGTPIHFGDDTIGQVVDAPLPASGGWNLARIADVALAQAAYQIAHEHRLWLPTMNKSAAVQIPITTVGAIGETGPYHMDVNANTATGDIRGPFDIALRKPNSTPTYPVLWSHDAEGERTMMFEADSEGLPRKGVTPKDQAFVDEKDRETLENSIALSF